MIDGLDLPRLVDLVIGITLAEAGLLGLYHRLTGRGVAPRDYLVNLLAGLGLMLALRAALADAGAVWVLAPLALAGAAHAVDLSRRWRPAR